MINGQTALYGIIGNPVQHSLSPIIHNAAFRRIGLNAVYLAFEVNNLEKAMMGIRELDIRGVSVTIPFKTEVIPFLDGVDEVAWKIKAVNTIVKESGRMIGHNTDLHGALDALEEKGDLKDKRVILLGAGGAARAIGFGLKKKGCQVILFNRSQNRAQILAEELGCVYHPLSCLEEMNGDILINATSVGMCPLDGEILIPKEILKKRMVVMDIVYRPLQTKLLQEAEERGCLTINGLEMLARQGAAQVEIWTGKKPGLSEIKDDLYRSLGTER